MSEEEYKTIKIRQSTYLKLKQVAGDRPISQVVDEMVNIYSIKIDKLAEDMVKRASIFMQNVEKIAKTIPFEFEVLRKRMQVYETGDIVDIDASFSIKIPNSALRNAIIRAIKGVEA